MPHAPHLRLGTRASPLARWQAEWVAGQLARHGCGVEFVPLSTHGDEERSDSIGAIGTQGVFTKNIQRALLAGQIDLAVHSLKDLPTQAVAGLLLAAVSQRGPAGDVLVSRHAARLQELPPGAVVGTGSLRRRSQLLHARPDLVMRDIRGNVETRLARLDDGHYDALVLAEAGLVRLDLAARISEVLPTSMMLPAVGQGALGIEAREQDERTRRLLEPLDHAATRQAVSAERSMLHALRGGCLAPVGAWGRIKPDGRLHLDGVVLSSDGARRLFASRWSVPADAHALGEALAAELLGLGAGELIESSRGLAPPPASDGPATSGTSNGPPSGPPSDQPGTSG